MTNTTNDSKAAIEINISAFLSKTIRKAFMSRAEYAVMIEKFTTITALNMGRTKKKLK